MIKINPSRIEGLWRQGWALDIHTLSSTPIGEDEYGHMQFHNERSEIGELLYRMKFRADPEVGPALVEAALGFLKSSSLKWDMMVPVPPSSGRPLQPVTLLANGIGQGLDLTVSECIAATRPTAQLKNVYDLERRKALLNGLYSVLPLVTQGKRILLFDDLYRSGATMNAITSELLDAGQAESVDAFVITRTRKHR